MLAIGARGNGNGIGPSSPQFGTVFLYATNGDLIITVTNPFPVRYVDNFGASLSALGPDRLIVASPTAVLGTTYSPDMVFLFSTNGLNLCTFTNPTATVTDGFGAPVAAVGTDRVLIGASSPFKK